MSSIRTKAASTITAADLAAAFQSASAPQQPQASARSGYIGRGLMPLLPSRAGASLNRATLVQIREGIPSITRILAATAIAGTLATGLGAVAAAASDYSPAGLVLRANPDDSIDWGKVARVVGSDVECWSLASSYSGGYCQKSGSGAWLVMVP
jgi:hypothetical protein